MPITRGRRTATVVVDVNIPAIYFSRTDLVLAKTRYQVQQAVDYAYLNTLLHSQPQATSCTAVVAQQRIFIFIFSFSPGGGAVLSLFDSFDQVWFSSS